MSLPYAVNSVGPLFAGILLVLVFIMGIVCTMLLLEVADHSKFRGDKYETIGELVWGLKGKYFIEIVLHATLIFGYVGAVVFT